MEKKYVNWITCKAREWKYGEFFNISINLEKLKEFQNEKGYVNLVMNKRREEGKYWETHTFTLNEWKPKKDKYAVDPLPWDEAFDEISIGDIPF